MLLAAMGYPVVGRCHAAQSAGQLTAWRRRFGFDGPATNVARRVVLLTPHDVELLGLVENGVKRIPPDDGE